MRPQVAALWAEEIRKCRSQYIYEATDAALDAKFPADVIRGIAFRAGEQWDRDHPLLASRAGAS